MTAREFQDHCEEIALDESNENWNSRTVLDRIAGEIGTVSLDFEADTGLALARMER